MFGVALALALNLGAQKPNTITIGPLDKPPGQPSPNHASSGALVNLYYSDCKLHMGRCISENTCKHFVTGVRVNLKRLLSLPPEHRSLNTQPRVQRDDCTACLALKHRFFGENEQTLVKVHLYSAEALPM